MTTFLPSTSARNARFNLEKLTNEYERKYGPLCLASPSNDVYPYAWVKCPWPWEVK